jgi:RNA polymerase sigma-70 factor (ECF subfamily)
VTADLPFDIRRILARIAGGDTAAFGEIVTRYQKPLFGFLGRMGLPQAQAEDIAQDTFLRAWRNLGTFEPERAEFSTWLFTIARNAALNDRARPAARMQSPGMDDQDLSEAACEQLGPDEALHAARQGERLRAALCRLDAADRTLIALAYTRELQLDAIARIEGCTLGAIKTRLHRARRQLHEILMEESDEFRT